MPWSSVILAFGQLNQPAERVDESHLLDGAAVNVQQLGIAYQNREAAGAGDRDVESVAAIEELDIAGNLSARGGGHRKEHDVGLLTLELVDRPDADTVGKPIDKTANLCVVRRDDHDVLELQPSFDAIRLSDGCVSEAGDGR